MNITWTDESWEEYEHRLVYEVTDYSVVIISCRYHY